MAKLIGTDPNQVPTNADLGTMAYQDKGNLSVGTVDTTGDVGINTASGLTDLTIAHYGHGLGLGHEGATLPSLAGLYTSSSTTYGQAYGSLIVKSRTDYAGYSIIFRTQSGEAARFNSAGNLAFPNGQGIDFSASQGSGASSSVLGDYEEGTWNGTDGSGAGLTLTLVNNTYIKVGKLVTCAANVVWPTNSDTRLARVTLPFTSVTTNSQQGGVVIEQDYNSTTTLTAALNYTDGVIFRPRGYGNLSNANLSGKRLRFMLTYHAA